MSKLIRLARTGCCTYCDRRVTMPRQNGPKLMATRDHVHPKSKGGRVWVMSCRACNELKGDLLPAQWRTVMHMNPRWWKTFQTNAQVRAWLRSLDATTTLPARLGAPS